MTNIVPHHGVGGVTFGMTRAEVAAAVGRPPRRSKKLSQFDPSEIDFFDHFDVYYDASDKCHAIEFTRNRPGVTYDGYDLFAHPPDQVRAWARARDPNLEEKEGFLSRALGLSMYAPYIDEPDLDDEERSQPAQCFLVFRPGYWEAERERLDALYPLPGTPGG